MASPLAARSPFSGLNRQVLRLYKNFLRLAETKGGACESIKETLRKEFRANASIPKRNIMKIEYLLRRGGNQYETLKSATVNKMSFNKVPET